MKKLIKENWFKILVVILLFLALADNPYGYYQFLRWAVLIIGSYSAYLSYEKGKNGWAWIFVIIAILFNPIIPFYLSRDIWQIIDLISGVLFLASLIKVEKTLTMNKAIKNLIRWIAVLPLSFLGLILSFALWKIIHNITSYGYIDPNSWLNIFFIEIMSNLISGAAFVYIGFKVAPTHQKIVAAVLTFLLVSISLISLFIVNFIEKDYFSNIGIISGIVGSIACCISVFKNELNGKII